VSPTRNPKGDYGGAQREAIPLSAPQQGGETTALLQVDGLVKHYLLPRAHLLAAPPVVAALQGVSFAVQAGHSLGVVGESGSGKSTLARLVMALEPPTAGTVRLSGQDLHALDATALRRARAGFQMVFQDPFGSLDPRQTVGRIVAEPLAAQGGEGWLATAAAVPRGEQQQRAAAMLEAVGLRASDASKYPHEFSGGQRQRIAIARALVTSPKLIVADEPVSALDVSVQAQVLNLMQDLQDSLGVTYLFISHDLAVVDLVCDEVLVLYQGRVVEQGSPQTLFTAAAHPYTRALMDAVPQARPAALRRPRGVAMASEPRYEQAGACPFAPRCSWRQPGCAAAAPALRPLGPGHQVACHRAEQVLGAGTP
jgi:peptide/nickel transport system ATP-binding protein